jgi:hypothetical protein
MLLGVSSNIGLEDYFCFEVVLVDCSIDTYDGRRIEAFQICGLRTHVELNVNKSNNIKF